jgi:hypothetical protein
LHSGGKLVIRQYNGFLEQAPNWPRGQPLVFINKVPIRNEALLLAWFIFVWFTMASAPEGQS